MGACVLVDDNRLQWHHAEAVDRFFQGRIDAGRRGKGHALYQKAAHTGVVDLKGPGARHHGCQ